ncbi:hypothetical protein CQA53_08960 [Helicobacter didelphidarum]|uniref:Uncharacterized protein n=1 Tax=Helicobacter didelphidarum TaxID=2040648 RepID=A0A3D8ICD3_9HELI|nr:hypothetical protein [Helicobacter didelphidarum]RDU62827.1 hypothetical protein CQA53_08960 [Helicobacter didelphidarum]
MNDTTIENVNEFVVEGKKIRFKPLTMGEGLKISSHLTSCMDMSNFDNMGNNDIKQNLDLGKFMNKTMNLIVSKIEVCFIRDNGVENWQSLENIESVSIFFKSPFVFINFTTCFMHYITPLVTSNFTQEQRLSVAQQQIEVNQKLDTQKNP